MVRHAFLVGTVLVFLVSGSAPLYGWGSATHAYIARAAGDQQGPASLPEMYGAVLPDLFNLSFGDPYRESLWTPTHYEVTKLVEKAVSAGDKALAYGFASHNEAWGADRTAHVSSVGHPESGYVIRKSEELAATLRPQVRLFLFFSGVLDPDPTIDEVLPMVAHTAVETAVDLLVSRNEDPEIGQRLVLAAQTRSWSAPVLLCKAYAADLAAATGTSEAVAAPLMVAAEAEFRLQIERYGTALLQENAAEALAQQGTELARQLLAAGGGLVLDIPEALMTQILDAALAAVKDDYAAQLAATVTQVRQELQSHGLAAAAW